MAAMNGGHVPPRSGSYGSNMNGLPNGPSSDFEVISQPGSAVASFYAVGGGQAAADLAHIAPLMSNAMPSMTEITLNQALQKIQELSKENAELRDFLRENNEVMKKQFQTLTEYKRKVSEANTYNREKFEQTKTLVLNLRSDNERLKQEVQASQLNNEVEALKTKMKDLEVSNKALSDHRTLGDVVIMDLQKEVDSLKEKLARETAEKAEMILVSKAGMPEEAEMVKSLESEKLELTLQENKVLQDDNARLMKDVRQFKSTADQLLTDLESTQGLKSNRERECQGLGQENARLSSELQQMLKEVCNVRERNDAMVLELQKLHGQLEQKKSTEPGDASFVYVAQASNIAAATTSVACMSSSSQTTDSMVGLNVGKTRDEPDDSQMTFQSTTMADILSQLQTERETTSTLRASLAEKNQQLQKLQSDLQVKEQVFLQNTTRIESSAEEVTAGQAKVIADIQATTDKLGRQSEQQDKESQCISYQDVHSLKYQVMTLINEVHESQTKFRAASDAVDTKNKRLSEMETENVALNVKLERQRSQDDALIDSMRIALMNQEEALLAERGEHQHTRKQLADIRGSFNQLVTDYKELLDTFDQYRLSQEKSTSTRHKAEVDQLMVQVIGAEEALAFKDTQIFNLKKELQKMSQEVEKIPVLKAQADVYKADFDAERKAREKQHEEKDGIIQEMSNLQIQNQQLLDELDSYSRNQIVEMQQRHASINPYGVVPNHRPPVEGQHRIHMVPSAPSVAQPQGLSQGQGQRGYPYPGPVTPAAGDNWGYPADPAYGQPGSRSSDISQPDEYSVPSCPKCGLQCPDLDTLQIHVIECLDQDLLTN